MTPMLEIGEMVISTDKTDYFFRPSFANMTRIGDPKQIVDIFALLNGIEIQNLLRQATINYQKIPDWLFKMINKPVYGRNILQLAMLVMQSCCNDECDEIIGEWKPGKRGLVYKQGKMPISDIILIARELFTHGVIGKAKIRQLQRNESQNDFSDSFLSIEYISAARAHFGMTRYDAEQLTMTEFQLMLKAKYPDEKGFTKEEYNAIMEEDDKRNDELTSGKRRLVSRKRKLSN
ncbi:DUF6246 family protein [Proteus terrae]|uniref:DUF6246 family protein n=1 Tax=Proteus terrae TaxID=1574161 RepID=UPI00298D4383|nr:DUF6246 family protein [Proteus terrae]WPC97880.1 DUF6246 family protein [Proteus terrae]